MISLLVEIPTTRSNKFIATKTQIVETIEKIGNINLILQVKKQSATMRLIIKSRASCQKGV
jgi:rRNA processing protein Krr1/Pno1